MAFAFNNTGGSAPSVNAGEEIAEINPEVIGFKGIGSGTKAGEKKVKLLPNPWPADNLPPASASLLSVASKRGLVAAAGPDSLVVAHTDSVRKAFLEEGDEQKVVAFTPDVVTRVPQLRHVAFSSNNDFLVITAESGGGLAVYGVEALLQQNTKPGVEIPTDSTSVRALVPNPNEELEHVFATVLDSGKLVIADVSQGKSRSAIENGVNCVAFSNKGKAFIAGLADGTAVQHKTDDFSHMATIPQPPELPEDYTTSAVAWLTDNEFLIIYSAKPGPDDMDGGMPPETLYYLVQTDKKRTTFTFRKTTSELVFASASGPGENRPGPVRFAFNRLRRWEPDNVDMVILSASNATELAILGNASSPLDKYFMSVVNEYAILKLLDNRQALLPMTAEDEDSVVIGEALDLSSKEKVELPIPADIEIAESPTPLPAYLALSYEGLLSGWWVVYDRSIRAETGYPGLATASTEQSATPGPQTTNTAMQPATPGPEATNTATQPTQTPSIFNQPKASFGTPSTPSFGTPSFGGGNAAFGQPSQPAAKPTLFGQPSFGAASTPGQPSQPAFGSASAIGTSGGTAFGATGGLGNRASPWAAASPSTTTPKANPFASQGGAPSGFAKFGEANKPASASPFSSFGSTSGQSGFASFSGQKNAFSGTNDQPSLFGGKGLNRVASAASTVTIGSKDGSTLPSWSNTPAQQSGSIFGAGTSSFASSKESDMSDAGDAQKRERDEATPTPQAPPQEPKGLFGLPANGFKLGATFVGDGSAKDDLPKPPAPSDQSLFGGDFASTLGGSSSKPPATPIKKEEEEPKLQDISTTPATIPKPTPSNIFSTNTPLQQPPALKKPDEDKVVPEDAPLPTASWKPSKSSDDDLPPLAGSPAIKVEAPESDVPSSPLDDSTEKEDEFSVEEDDGDDEEEDEPSPSDAARRPRPSKTQWSFQDSTTQSPRILPAAPTPPVMKSGASSRSGNESRDTSRPPSALNFGQAAHKPAPSVLFPPTSTTPFSKPPVSFNPPTQRGQDNLRSPSPVRAASTSAIGTRRQQVFPPQGTPLASSVQQKPPTPQPEVSDLSDDEDERIRQELASEITPSRDLDPFIAHQDYTGNVSKTGTAAQIEIMYRDMNSMVDTLGLNSRSLASFIQFHQQRMSLSRDDLDEVADQGEEGPWSQKWSLAAAQDLSDLLDQMEADLERHKLQGKAQKEAELGVLMKDHSKVLTRLNNVRREIINRKDPEKLEAIKKASLPKDLAEQQRAILKAYSDVLTYVNQAETDAAILKSRIASIEAQNGKPAAVPTVDAVKKTINRLIQMTEKKNSDILILEAQVRKLGLNGNLNGSVHSSRPTSSSSRTPLRNSRALVRTTEQSPMSTPRNKMTISQLNRSIRTPEPEDSTPSKGYGLYYTPDASPNGAHASSLAELGDRTRQADQAALKASSNRRKDIAKKLGDVVKKRGVRVTKVAGVQ